MGKGLSEIEMIARRHVGSIRRINHLFIQPSLPGAEFNRRTRFEAPSDAPFLIDDAINTTRLWIHHNHGTGVIAKGINGDATNFGIFSGRIVFPDETVSFVTLCLIKGARARDGGATRSFSPPPSNFQLAPMTTF